MFKKVLALVLALLMVIPMLAACGGKKAAVDDETSAKATKATTTLSDEDDEDVDDTEADEEDEEYEEDEADTKVEISIDYTANTDIVFEDTTIYDEMTLDQLRNPENFEGSDIPESRDYGGYQFNILADDFNVDYEFCDQSDGDIVKESVIDRQYWISEYVGIEFIITPINAGYWNMDAFCAEIEAASGAGSPYDLALAYSHIPPVVAAKGLSRDLAESENLNLLKTTKEYWGSGIKEEIMIGGRIFWMSDNSSWDSVRNLLCVFVNVDFFTRANPEFDQTNLYRMVEGGAWTFENMLLFIQNAYENTNEEKPEADRKDTYGLLPGIYYYSIENWLYGAGFSLTRINSRGTYEWTIGDQSFIDFSDWWQSTVDNNINIAKESGEVAEGLATFTEERAMFTMAPFKIIEKQLELDFTVLPLPIYDPDIKNAYSTPILNDYGSWLIPKATKKDAFERSATVLELIAAEGNRRIAPVYFEIYLKRQNAGHDKDMQTMFNIIRNAIMFDIGFLYGSVLTYEKPSGGGYEEVFIALRRMWGTESNAFYSNVSTVWASISSGVTLKLKNLMVDILDY